MKKLSGLILLAFLINTCFISIANGEIVTTVNAENGSLSGYVTDEEMSSISDALITITCGENSFECYSDETGYYIRDDLPLAFCIWNITASKEGYETAYYEMSIGTNSTYNFTLISIDAVELEVEVLAGLSFPTPLIRVENVGDGIAHNVELTNVAITGNVVYNNREFTIASTLEPDNSHIIGLNSWMIGFGSFTIIITVSCDEGTFSSDATNGLIIGPFIFIP